MSENPRVLKAGDKVGKYEILGVLGSGGIATCYAAESRLLKRKVAIKLFTTRDADLLALVYRTSEIQASLDHPYIVSLYDLDEWNGYLYQVEQFVDGKSLSGRIESGDELPVTVALSLLIGIADTLEYVHSLGLVHRDVKPANIIISTGGSPYLTDFGISESVDALQPDSRRLGTLPYMSPEALQGMPDQRSDLWSLGMTTHYALTRRLPFRSTDQAEVARAITSECPLDLSMLYSLVPEPVARIVERCLQKDLDVRYQSAGEVRRDLESALVFLESGEVETAPMAVGSGRRILLNVEYKEPGIPGQYREYQIEDELGSGSFALVHRARDIIGERSVALKILRPERADNERTLIRFQREAQLLARLHHPNVVRVYNFGRYVADFFIVMEILDGLTVRKALEHRFDFGVQQAAAVVAQVLAGLGAIHAEGVVHRDISPRNVMLQPERAVVMDLGIAHISAETQLTVSGEIYGTPRYMSPEQIRGQTVTVLSDLYAAGVLLYELLSGTVPHEADTAASLLFKIAAEDPEPITVHRSDLPPSLVSTIDRMVAREPEGRFQSTDSAYEALLASVGLGRDEVATVHRGMFDQLQAVIRG